MLKGKNNQDKYTSVRVRVRVRMRLKGKIYILRNYNTHNSKKRT